MKKMRRWISALLATVMTVLAFGAFPVSAAESAVIYTEDFEKYEAGSKPSGVMVVENTTKMLMVRTEKEENGNSVVHIYADPAGASGGPRFAVKTDATKYTELTIAFKAKSAGSNALVEFATDGGKTANTKTVVASLADKNWTDVEIKIDLSKMVCTATAGGKQITKEKALHTIDDPTTAEIRFSASTPKPGEGAYFDNIVITASGAGVTPEPSAPAQSGGTSGMPKTIPTKVTVAADKFSVIDTDFTGAKIGSAVKSGLFSGTNFVDIYEAEGNRLMRYWSEDGAKHYPRVELNIPAQANTYEMDFAVALAGAPFFTLNMHVDGKNTPMFKLNSTTTGLKAGDWNYVHISFDFTAGTASVSLNGAKATSVALPEIADRNKVSLRIESMVEGTNEIYLDALTIYTNEKVEYTGILKGKNEVVFENVKPAKELSSASYVNNLRAHPRIFVKDWEEMKNIINSSHEARMWYNNLKIAADGYLTTKATYNVNSRGNILESSRAAEGRLQTLSFVYKITGDKRYFDKAYEEMLEYGTWPDWSGFISSLVTAEIMFGYACAYDWLYYDLTAAQRTEIRNIVKKLALPDMIYNYEGVRTSTNFTSSTINWNPVCNACMIGTAFAFADEEPNLSEYILEKAPEYIINALSPYAPEGGYPEGVMYWDYGTTFLCFAMDMLEYGFKDGFVLPEKYKYYNYPGIAETSDFPIYYTSSVGKFDYGDASGGSVNSEVFYWMARRFNKPQYAWFENKVQFDKGSYLSGYSAIFALASYDKDNATVAPGAFSLDKFYASEEDVNGITMRSSWAGDRELYAAMQGGNNAENHMHWSLGTYVIDYHKKRFVDEDLSTDYALKGAKETIYYKRAEAHNTLVINPSAGPDQVQKSVAKVVKSGTSANTAFGILDMTPTHADYVSAKRGMMLTDNRNRVIVQDEVVANKPSEFYWFANTAAGVKIAKDGKSAVLNREGEEMLVRIIEGPAEAKFTVMERQSLIDSITAGEQGGIKLAIHIPQATTLNLAVEYIGLEKGEGIPAPNAYVPLDQWTANDNDMTAVAMAGTATVLKLNSPNAIAKGEKTYVDPANYEVVPFTENSRTLVPVRFISESFGAKVGWNDATQAVTVKYKDKDISLQIGSNLMYVNGEQVVLDTPANTYNSRTLIPLRALVEALGKTVHWDDRGLIIIADDDTPYSAEAIDKLVTELNVRVTVNGQDMTFFELDRENYVLNVKSGEAVPQIGVTTIGAEAVAVTQANAVGEAAVVTVNGKNYTIRIENDPFEGVYGSKDPGVIVDLSIERAGIQMPDHNTFIYVEDLVDSTGFATYPKRGIVDGVINEAIANRWAAQGEGWIQMDFGKEETIYSMAFAGVTQTQRAYKFDVEISNNGDNWTKVHEGGAPTTDAKMSIIPLGGLKARYVKLTGYGNNINAWNTWAEVRFYNSEAQQNEDKSYWDVYFGGSGIAGKVGTTQQIKVVGIDANSDSFELKPTAKVTYSVADPSMATVTADGVVTFLKAGKTTLKVMAEQDGFSVTETVNVEIQ